MLLRFTITISLRGWSSICTESVSNTGSFLRCNHFDTDTVSKTFGCVGGYFISARLAPTYMRARRNPLVCGSTLYTAKLWAGVYNIYDTTYIGWNNDGNSSVYVYENDRYVSSTETMHDFVARYQLAVAKAWHLWTYHIKIVCYH